MPVCQADGVTFVYPEGWELSRDEHGTDVTWHLQTDGSAFWSLTLLASCPTAEEAVEAVVDAFREEYPDLDVYSGPDTPLPGPAAGCDIDFVYVDLVNAARIRAEATSVFTAVVVYQGEDREVELYREQFEAITRSLRYHGDWSDHDHDHDFDLSHDHDHHGDCGPGCDHEHG